MMAEHVRNLKPSAKSGKRFLAVVRNRKCNRNHLRRCLLPAGLLDIRAGSPQNPSSSKHTRQPPVPRTLTSRLLPFTLSLDRWLARLYSAVRVALEVHKRFGPSENEPPTVHVFVHVIKLGTVHPDSKRQALARRLLALGLALLWVREPGGGSGTATTTRLEVWGRLRGSQVLQEFEINVPRGPAMGRLISNARKCRACRGGQG